MVGLKELPELKHAYVSTWFNVISDWNNLISLEYMTMKIPVDNHLILVVDFDVQSEKGAEL